MNSIIIYALELESNKFYIGKTQRTEGSELRFQEHQTGRGSEWTKIFKPISIIETYEHHSTFEEDVLTKKYMMKYGIDNVRGGSYTKIDLEEWQVKSLEHEFKSVSDKCFKCGRSGHFASKCNKGLYSEYLVKFETEEQIEKEISILENIRVKVSNDKYVIARYKYISIDINKSSKHSLNAETKIVEIEPSLIDKYNMNKITFTPNLINIRYTSIQEITGEIIYSYIVEIFQRHEISNSMFIHPENIIETIYKIYVFRRRLERNYLDLVKDLEYEDKTNFDEILKEADKKIEMLYEKLTRIIS